MDNTESKRQKEDQGLKEVDFKRLILLLEKIGPGIELLYYLMNNKKEDSFVVAFISATDIKLADHINHTKRDTDTLFEIDKEQQLYALICQETEVDGGYYFMKRLVKTIQEKGGKNIYCSEIGVENTEHTIQEIAFRLLNMYRRTKAKKADGEISFHTLR